MAKQKPQHEKINVPKIILEEFPSSVVKYVSCGQGNKVCYTLSVLARPDVLLPLHDVNKTCYVLMVAHRRGIPFKVLDNKIYLAFEYGGDGCSKTLATDCANSFGNLCGELCRLCARNKTTGK